MYIFDLMLPRMKAMNFLMLLHTSSTRFTNVVQYLLNSVAPIILPFSFGDEPANSGDSNAMQCMVTKGDLPLSVIWSLNGKLVRSGENGIIVVKVSPRVSTLTIESISSFHRGNFMCIAENAAGESNFTTELRVNGEFGEIVLFF